MYNLDIHEFTHIIGTQSFRSGVSRQHIVSYDIIKSGESFYGVRLKTILGDEFTLLGESGEGFLDWYAG